MRSFFQSARGPVTADLPGALAYAQSRDDAILKAKA